MIAAGPGPRAHQPVLLTAPQTLSAARLYARLAASGLSAPVAMANAGDGSGRIFVVQKAGVISVVKNGVTLGTPFLDIQTLVNSTGGEQGLLGLAFHPNYAVNGQFYTVYTDAAGSLTLSRFLVSAGNPDVADPTSQSVLLTIPHPECTNHNGGQLAFGPDGFLYWSTGDGAGTTGACGGDPLNNAQNTNVLLGKILRLDVDHTDPGLNYAIPSTNPFFSVTGSRGEIWDYGLRNAWRFSFDRLTHDIYIGDVGQNLLEEVDFEPAGGPGGVNYGWRVMEGTSCFNESNFNQPLASCNTSGKQLPVTEYDHSSGRCAITGGYVYRGGLYYLLQGHYFYGDFCNG